MTPLHSLSTSERELSAARQRARVLAKQVSLLKAELRLLAQSHAETHRRAHFDALTGLPNRFLLQDRFHQAMAHATRMRTRLALLYLDIDGFKAVNDALGHATGDELLKRVAARLLACVRASDTVCRHGGDEFVILLTEVTDDDGAFRAAEKLRAYLAMPYVIGGTAIQLTASIGAAVYPRDGREYSELLERSDFVMFRKKGDVSARPSIVRRAPGFASDAAESNLGQGELLDEKDSSPTGECCGEPKQDETAGKLPNGSSSTLIGTTPKGMAGSPCGFLQTP